jgi:hypothetical protein
MPVNDPKTVAEVTAAFQRYERALIDNDVATLTTLFWKSPLTVRCGLAESLYGHDAITAFRQGRPNVDLQRTLANTLITTYDRTSRAPTPSSPSTTRLDAGGRARRGCGRRRAGGS